MRGIFLNMFVFENKYRWQNLSNYSQVFFICMAVRQHKVAPHACSRSVHFGERPERLCGRERGRVFERNHDSIDILFSVCVTEPHGAGQRKDATGTGEHRVCVAPVMFARLWVCV